MDNLDILSVIERLNRATTTPVEKNQHMLSSLLLVFFRLTLYLSFDGYSTNRPTHTHTSPIALPGPVHKAVGKNGR